MVPVFEALDRNYGSTATTIKAFTTWKIIAHQFPRYLLHRSSEDTGPLHQTPRRKFDAIMPTKKPLNLFAMPIKKHPSNRSFPYCVKRLAYFHFCVVALNAWAEIYVSIDPPSFERAEATCKLGISASRLLWPDMEQESKIDYGHKENRPLLRTYFILARVQRDMEKFEDAVEKYRFLLRVNPNDDQGVRIFLFWTLILAGGCKDYKLAEAELKKHTGGRNSIDATVCYDYVLVDYIKYKFFSGLWTEAKLKATLVRALTHNSFVAYLLVGEIWIPVQLQDECPGSIIEAACIANRTRDMWTGISGILEWLREQKDYGGKKPDDDGTILFQLLQKGTILVERKNSNHLWRLTTKVDQMSGQERSDFCLAPGMKEHNPVKIVAFDCDKAFEKDGSFLENFTSFSYDDVAEIPFWKILYKSKAFGEVKQDCSVCCKQTATFTCSVCEITHYCSRTCQKKDWRAGHKAQCPKFIKT